MTGVLLAGLLVGGTLNNDTPPVKYQDNAYALVITVTNPNTKEACGVAPDGWRFMGCTYYKDKLPIMMLPNPCQYDYEIYGHLMCHEFGHVNGWNSTHDN